MKCDDWCGQSKRSSVTCRSVGWGFPRRSLLGSPPSPRHSRPTSPVPRWTSPEGSACAPDGTSRAGWSRSGRNEPNGIRACGTVGSGRWRSALVDHRVDGVVRREVAVVVLDRRARASNGLRVLAGMGCCLGLSRPPAVLDPDGCDTRRPGTARVQRGANAPLGRGRRPFGLKRVHLPSPGQHCSPYRWWWPPPPPEVISTLLFHRLLQLRTARPGKAIPATAGSPTPVLTPSGRDRCEPQNPMGAP